MEHVTNRKFIIEEKYWDAAAAEVEKRLAEGEDLTAIYAAWSNELEHCVKEKMSAERINELRGKEVYLAQRLALEYMEEHGWSLNDNGRYTYAKKSDQSEHKIRDIRVNAEKSTLRGGISKLAAVNLYFILCSVFP